MDSMMLLAGGGASLKTVVFNSSQTWVAPLTVPTLASLKGRGVGGTAATTASSSAVCVNVAYDTTQYPPAQTIGNYGWSYAYSVDAFNAMNFLNNTGSYTAVDIAQYGHPSFGDTYIKSTSPQSVSSYVYGSAYLTYTGGFATSGDIRASGQAVLNWQYNVPATNGANATAFGKTFPGGVGGPAVLQDYGPQTITPGGSYPILVPVGAQITIQYYE